MTIEQFSEQMISEIKSFRVEKYAQELIDKGYKTYRKTFDKKKGHELVPFKWNNIYIASNFNYMVSGGCDIRFIKEGEKEIIIGLGYSGQIGVI